MNLPSIDVDSKALSLFEDAIRKEWIVTNGLGGYASSTVISVNTRKYHGLLVAALHPPRDRRVFLVKLDEDVHVGSNVHRLGANEFQNGFFPQGYVFLKEFTLSPFPKYVYSVQEVEVEKTIFMPYGKNAVIIMYDLANGNGTEVKVQIYPITNGRRFHSVTEKSSGQNEFVQQQADKTTELSQTSMLPAMMMATTKGHYFVKENWIERMYLREEARRGESCFDDCYQPGFFEADVEPKSNISFAIMAVAGPSEVEARKMLAQFPSTVVEIKALIKKEAERNVSVVEEFHRLHKGLASADWLSWLTLATDTFVVDGSSEQEKVIIAGYHWFETWGRDAFISLPGLLLVNGRFEDARKILVSFKRYCRWGLIPNLLPELGGQPVYNAVDASLWYVNAVLQYLKYTGDFRFVQEELWETLKIIVDSHLKGTDFGIHVDADGLLSHGPQLTWVDASVDGKPVNPRAGKAVEVQALWYNALKTGELLAVGFEERDVAEECRNVSEKAKKSFAEKFWNVERGCLFDTVGESGLDGSLRPNQIVAVALDFIMLDDAKNGRVVDAVERELLTPCGLRTLAQDDPKYVGVYAGDRASRDRAYHNGTVWPWLLGPFTTAFLKAKGSSDFMREYAFRKFLEPLLTRQIYESGLGTLNEIFDGDAPHLPRGCISQAWSVAEPLRAYVEDIVGIRPKYERDVLKGS
jgi:predicted glycogen debranching enzyme